MEIHRFRLDFLPESIPGLTLALGNFDGMHRGHQRLLLDTSFLAKNESGVLLFDPPSPFKGNNVLTSLEQKIAICRKLRLDHVFVLESNKAFWNLSPQEFCDQILKKLGASLLCCGEDFRFGKKAEGKVDDLKKDFDVHLTPFLESNGIKISSSFIREAIQNGEVEKAADWLGRPYEMAGKVAHGFRNGHLIGFPTLNLKSSTPYCLPRFGVYCGLAYIDGIPHQAVINVGVHPTIDQIEEPSIEAHLLDFEEEAYDKTLYLDFRHFERCEKKFASLEELSKQLLLDKAWAKEQLSKE